jgi:hypothetical protein
MSSYFFNKNLWYYILKVSLCLHVQIKPEFIPKNVMLLGNGIRIYSCDFNKQPIFVSAHVEPCQ